MFCLAAVAGSRAFLLAAGALSQAWNGVPFDWLGMWVRWDAVLYLDIAANGYSQSPLFTGPLIGAGNLAFFPLYPLAMRILGTVLPAGPAAGIALSNLCLLLAAILLYRMACFRGGPGAAQCAVAVLVSFPGSFIFSAVMTESTYLLLTVAGFYFAQRMQFVAAGLSAAFAAVTRPVGVLLVPCLLLDQLFPLEGKLAPAPSWRPIAIIMAAPLLLMAYLLYLWWSFGDAFAFMNVQIFWWRQSSDPLTVIWNGLTAGDSANLFLTVFGLAGLAILLAGARWLTVGELTFAMANMLIPFSSAAASMPRYMIAQFPIHLVLGLAAHRHPRLRLPLIGTLLISNGFAMAAWAVDNALFM